jgi:drug/metabolite transporter (DMT)-like permease
MDIILVTFLQLFVSSLVLSILTLLTVDLSILHEAPPRALINFALAGFVHFFAGWTFMNASQKRVGAARTSPLIGTTPLFGAALAAITLREFPTLVSWIAILLMIIGIYMISDRPQGFVGGGESSNNSFFIRNGLKDSFFGLATALCWATSPIFIRLGLDDIPSPLLGVTIGMVTCVFTYAVLIILRSKRIRATTKMSGDFYIVLIAGLILGLATWARWIGLELTKVATVLSLSLLSIPVVMVLSPILYGRQLERISLSLVIGAVFIMGGSLLLIYAG